MWPRVIVGNPIARRGRYTIADEVRRCREVAPTPEGLQAIIGWLRKRTETAIADFVAFLTYSGLRIGEALPLTWQAVNLAEGLVNVKREKRGVNPWIAILPEMQTLLCDMAERAKSALLFPSPFEPSKPRDHSAVGHRLATACRKLKIDHVTPHGLRSYFVTQARQSGLTDAEIAALIGDKSGPSLIASTYGDLRPDHLLAQARRIRHTVASDGDETSGKASHKASHTMPADEDVIHLESARIQEA
jgi:integrase